MSDILYGKNTIMEALNSGRNIEKILVVDLAGSFSKIVETAERRGIPVEKTPKGKLDELAKNRRHQGVVAHIIPKDYVDIEHILSATQEKGEQPLIIALDHLEDPHNLGAILRVVDGVGAHGVVIPKARSVSLSATVGKTSAGAMEYVPVARVSNLNQTLIQLKKQGLWVAGLDGDAKKTIYDLDWNMPLVIVVGSEGKGLSRLVKENCDFLVKIPMRGEINSLNASVAAGVALYEGSRQRFLKR